MRLNLAAWILASALCTYAQFEPFDPEVLASFSSDFEVKTLGVGPSGTTYVVNGTIFPADVAFTATAVEGPNFLSETVAIPSASITAAAVCSFGSPDAKGDEFASCEAAGNNMGTTFSVTEPFVAAGTAGTPGFQPSTGTGATTTTSAVVSPSSGNSISISSPSQTTASGGSNAGSSSGAESIYSGVSSFLLAAAFGGWVLLR